MVDETLNVAISHDLTLGLYGSTLLYTHSPHSIRPQLIHDLAVPVYVPNTS